MVTVAAVLSQEVLELRAWNGLEARLLQRRRRILAVIGDIAPLRQVIH
jgi:hypothetical protein